MSGEHRYREVAFLDTNTLHYVSLYMKHAESKGLYPFVSRGDDDGKRAIAEARRHLDGMPEVKSTKSLRDGLDVLAWISTTEVRVEYSPITELELMAGRLKGRALEAAAKEGVPDRMWSRFVGKEDEVSARLTQDDLGKVRTGVAELESTLERTGVAVTVSAERAGEALDLAKDVAGLIYMGVVDCILYANALSVQAEYLVTNDGYFSRVVNRARSGPSGEINGRIRERVGLMLGIPVGKVVLPEAKKPGKLSVP